MSALIMTLDMTMAMNDFGFLWPSFHRTTKLQLGLSKTKKE